MSVFEANAIEHELLLCMAFNVLLLFCATWNLVHFGFVSVPISLSIATSLLLTWTPNDFCYMKYENPSKTIIFSA